MKTLDEVIKALEVCTSDHSGCDGCPYDPDCTPNYKWDEAIFYLKEYRDYQTSEETVTENDSVSEAENKPLTWYELRQMDGKPVWVEERYRNVDFKSSGWWLIDFWNDDQICLRDQAGNPWVVYQTGIGWAWRAYRKERK